MEYTEENADKSIQNQEILSDSTWKYTLNRTTKDEIWKKVKVLGYSPNINSYIYKPSLIDGERSYTEDNFGLKSNLYFISTTKIKNFN